MWPISRIILSPPVTECKMCHTNHLVLSCKTHLLRAQTISLSPRLSPWRSHTVIVNTDSGLSSLFNHCVCRLQRFGYASVGVKSDTPETLGPHQLLNKREQKQSTHCGNNINMTSSLYLMSNGRSCTCLFLLCNDTWAIFSTYFGIKKKKKAKANVKRKKYRLQL